MLVVTEDAFKDIPLGLTAGTSTEVSFADDGEPEVVSIGSSFAKVWPIVGESVVVNVAFERPLLCRGAR